MYDSGTILMIVIISVCLMFGFLLPSKPKKEFEWPFEVVIKPRPEPKVIIKEVVRYIDRPRDVVKLPAPIPTASPKQPIITKCIESPPIKLKKKEDNKQAFNEAKKGLMSLGYRAGDAKSVLESVGHCDTAEEYIRKAMIRTKK